MSNNQNMEEKKSIIHLYQYILDSKSGIVRDELYPYIIIRALFDHAQNKSLTKDAIIEEIKKDYNFSEFPEYHFNIALRKLLDNKIVIGKDKFALSQDKITEICQHNQIFIEFMDKILNELKNEIKNKCNDLPDELIKKTVENFYKLLGRTFTMHGKIASHIISNQNGTIDTLKQFDGFRKDYHSIVLELIPKHLQDKIDEIFNDFLFNPTPDRSKFFYHLAQSHTLLEILNVDPTLKRLEKEALRDTKFFIDTNVLIYLLFEKSRLSNAIEDIIKQSQKLGVSLYVNEITNEEFNHWLETSKKNVNQIKKIPKKLSEALFSKQIDAPLFTTYMDSLRQNPHQTVEQFCMKFENVGKLLEKNYGIVTDDEALNKLKNKKIFSKLQSQITRFSPLKGPRVSLHDTLCILKVKTYRENHPSGALGPKAWFFTTDSSLYKAEQKVFSGNEIRTGITPTLWLQIISPLISPELKTPETIKGFSKLVSMNFGIDSIIDQEDILNINAAFYDLDHLEVDELKGLIGDKHIRESLKKAHEAHLRHDEKEEKRWTDIGISITTEKLKDKHETEIEGFKDSIKEFTKRLDSTEKLVREQSKKIQSQSKQIETYGFKEKERKWRNTFLIRLFIALAVVILIPISLFVANLVTETSDIISVIFGEITVLVGIFVPWVVYHHMKSKKS